LIQKNSPAPWSHAEQPCPIERTAIFLLRCKDASRRFAAHVGDPRQEEAAHRIAWAAVKRSYVKIGGSWIARAGRG